MKFGDSTVVRLGGDRYAELVDYEINPFKNLFHQRPLQKNRSTSTVGFRMILLIDKKK